MVDFLGVIVGELLDILLGVLVIVLGDLGSLLLLLELLDSFAADVSDGDLVFLAVLLGLLDQDLYGAPRSAAETRDGSCGRRSGG